MGENTTGLNKEILDIRHKLSAKAAGPIADDGRLPLKVLFFDLDETLLTSTDPSVNAGSLDGLSFLGQVPWAADPSQNVDVIVNRGIVKLLRECTNQDHVKWYIISAGKWRADWLDITLMTNKNIADCFYYIKSGMGVGARKKTKRKGKKTTKPNGKKTTKPKGKKTTKPKGKKSYKFNYIYKFKVIPLFLSVSPLINDILSKSGNLSGSKFIVFIISSAKQELDKQIDQLKTPYKFNVIPH